MKKTANSEVPGRGLPGNYGNSVDSKIHCNGKTFIVVGNRKRWLMLAIYFGNALICGYQFTNYLMHPEIFKEFFSIESKKITLTTQDRVMNWELRNFEIETAISRISYRKTTSNPKRSFLCHLWC